MAKIKLTTLQKKLFIGLVAIALLASISATVWMRVAPSVDSDEKEKAPTEVSLNSVGSQAASHVANGDIEKAMNYYDEQINLTPGDREKKSLLVKKSIMATDIGKYDVAIASAKQADEIESDAATMRALADAYAASGDKEQALVYYRKLLALEESSQEVRGNEQGMQMGPSIESIIEALEQ